jgi:hypothetical protein
MVSKTSIGGAQKHLMALKMGAVALPRAGWEINVL